MEMLASFLEKESAPSNPIRLPTDHLSANISPDSLSVDGVSSVVRTRAVNHMAANPTDLNPSNQPVPPPQNPLLYGPKPPKRKASQPSLSRHRDMKN